MSKVKIVKLVNLHDNNKLFEYRERSNKILVNLNYQGAGKILTSVSEDQFNLGLFRIPIDRKDEMKSLFESLCDGYTYYETHIGDKSMLVLHEVLEANSEISVTMEFKNIFGTESRVDPMLYATPQVQDIVKLNRLGGK